MILDNLFYLSMFIVIALIIIVSIVYSKEKVNIVEEDSEKSDCTIQFLEDNNSDNSFKLSSTEFQKIKKLLKIKKLKVVEIRKVVKISKNAIKVDLSCNYSGKRKKIIPIDAKAILCNGDVDKIEFINSNILPIYKFPVKDEKIKITADMLAKQWIEENTRTINNLSLLKLHELDKLHKNINSYSFDIDGSILPTQKNIWSYIGLNLKDLQFISEFKIEEHKIVAFIK